MSKRSQMKIELFENYTEKRVVSHRHTYVNLYNTNQA